MLFYNFKYRKKIGETKSMVVQDWLFIIRSKHLIFYRMLEKCIYLVSLEKEC